MNALSVRSRASVLLLGLLIAAAACAADRTSVDRTPAADTSEAVLVAGGPTIGYPSGPAAWLDDGTIFYLMRHPGESDSPLHLYRTRQGGGIGKEVDLADVPSCANPYVTRLRRLSSGELGAVIECPQQPKPPSLVAIDPESGRVRPISDLHDGNDGVWSTAESRGWTVHNRGGCVSIAPMDGAGRRPIPMLHPGNLLPWPLDGDFLLGQGGCASRGMIGFPELLSTADRILVLASPEARNVAPGDLGRGRRRLPWHVYEIDMARQHVRQVGGTFFEPGGLAIASGKVVVAGDQDSQQGLYTVDLEDGQVELIKTGRFGAPALSPDGRSVLLVRYSIGGHPELIVRAIPS